MSGLRPEELRTHAAYEQYAVPWAVAHSTPGYWAPEMARFREMLPPPAAILEAGCGAGRDAADLIAAGYDYTGFDYSASMLALARQRLPGADFRKQEIRSVGLGIRQYDGLWSACALGVHTPKRNVGEDLRQVSACLHPGAVACFIVKEGRRDGFSDGGITGMDRWFTRWRPDEFGAVLACSGFRVTGWWQTGWGPLCFMARWDTAGFSPAAGIPGESFPGIVARPPEGG